MPPFNRIQSHPAILNGKPCIKGTRISVQLILEWTASGATPDEIAARHPHVTKEDVIQAIRYAEQQGQNHLPPEQ